MPKPYLMQMAVRVSSLLELLLIFAWKLLHLFVSVLDSMWECHRKSKFAEVGFLSEEPTLSKPTRRETEARGDRPRGGERRRGEGKGKVSLVASHLSVFRALCSTRDYGVSQTHLHPLAFS